MNEQGTIEPALQALQEEGTETFDQVPRAEVDAEAISVTGETALDEHGGLYGTPSTEAETSTLTESDTLRPAEKAIDPMIINEGTTVEAQDGLSTDNNTLSEMATQAVPPNDEVKPEIPDPLPGVGEVSIPEDKSGLRSDGTLREEQIQDFHNKGTAGLEDDINASEKKLDDRLSGNIPEEVDAPVVQEEKTLTDAFFDKAEKVREPMPESMVEKLVRLKQEREALRAEAQQRRDVLAAELNSVTADKDESSAREGERHQIELARIDSDYDSEVQGINEELAEIEKILGEA